MQDLEQASTTTIMSSPARDGLASLELVAIEDLKVDHRYQRELDQRRVERMGTNWDPVKAGTVTVNRRPYGHLFVVDGQHRLAAARVAGLDALQCAIYEISPLEEPRLFVELQKQRKNVLPFEQHRALLEYGDETASAVERAIRRAGYRVGTSKGHRVLRSVTALYKAYVRGEAWRRRGESVTGERHLEEVITVIDRSWGASQRHFNTTAVEGVSRFLCAYPEVGYVQLAERLARFDFSEYERRTNALRSVMTGSAAGDAATHAILGMWNHRRKNALDPQRIAERTRMTKASR